jgi:hypothetical protein
MRIGVSVLNYGHVLGGGANYGLTLFKQWERMGVDYVAYVRPGFADAAKRNGLNTDQLRIIDVPGGDGGVKHIAAMLLWNNVLLDRCLERDKVEVVFQADLFGAVFRRPGLPRVSAVHGVSHLFYPGSRSTSAYFRFLYRRLLNSSDLVIVISLSLWTDVERNLD